MVENEDKIEDNYKGNWKDWLDNEYETRVQGGETTIDSGSYHDQYFLIEKIHIFFPKDKHH